MNITQVHKPLLVVDPIVVFFVNAFTETDDEIRAAALEAANETPSSVFGVWVKRDVFEPGVVTVTINKD